jgi:hypothetical protein
MKTSSDRAKLFCQFVGGDYSQSIADEVSKELGQLGEHDFYSNAMTALHNVLNRHHNETYCGPTTSQGHIDLVT